MILRANSALRAVALHAGKHHVSFAYRPLSVRAGAFITILGAVLAILGISISEKIDNLVTTTAKFAITAPD